MNTKDGNDRTLPLDFTEHSSISYLNNQAKRLNDFSMLDSPNRNEKSDGQPFVSTDGRVRSREKYKIAHYSNPHSNDHSPDRSTSRSVSIMKEQDNLIGELKKECFGLKLRIYYMEEQLHETFEANTQDVLKDNVELKVAVEELKNEISNKTDLLTKASKAMEQITGEEHQVCNSIQGDTSAKLKKEYEIKLDEKGDRIKELEEKLLQLNEEIAENRNIDIDKKIQILLNEKDEKYKSIVMRKQEDKESLKSMICELEQTLATKESNIETLRKDLRRLASNKTNRSNQHFKALYEKGEKTLSEKEDVIAQFKTELTCKTNIIDSLNNQISNLNQGLNDTQGLYDEKELDFQKTIKQLQEEVKKLKSTISDKGKEIEDKDKALTEANEEKLLVQKQKMQYELDSMKKKDSRIIELEIKVKQQHIDFEKTVDEHNRCLRERDDDILRLQELCKTSQQEMKEMIVELNEYKLSHEDLSFRLQKSIEREKYLDNLVMQPNGGTISGSQEQMGTQKRLEIEEKEIIIIDSNEISLMKELELELIEDVNNDPIVSGHMMQCNDSSSKQLTNKHLEGVEDNGTVTQLRELSCEFKGLVENYRLLLEKLINNQHPTSQQRILEKEITQIESTRINFDKLLSIILNSPQNHGKEFVLPDNVNNHGNLNTPVENSRRQEEKLQVIRNEVSCKSKVHEENETSKTFVKKCEYNEKLNELFEMNMKLRKKVKSYELVITKKVEEINKFKEQLINYDQTIKKLEMVPINHIKKELQEYELNDLICNMGKVDELESVDRMYLPGNLNFTELEHFKIKVTHEEFTKLKELVDLFKDENSTLKADLRKERIEKKSIDLLNKELNEKVNELNLMQSKLYDKTKELEEKVEENKELEYALQNKQDEIDLLSNQITILRSSLKDQSEEITEKENQLAMLAEELQRNSIDMNEKLNEIANLHNSLEKQTKELEQISNDNKDLHLELEKIHGMLEDTKLTDKLTSELIESKSLINSLQSQIAFCSGNHVDVIRLKDEINQLEKAKLQLKDNNRKLKESAGEMSEKLSTTLEENNMKIEEIKVLKTQMINLEEKIESFSPLYTSSANNIALSSDAFTQTQLDPSPSKSNDSLITQHINEMQHLRKQLEETISNNDSLRKQLEERLNELEEDANLLQDPNLRINLVRDNDSMRCKLNEADENKKTLTHQIENLTQEKDVDKATITTLNSQMQELNILATNLKVEMEAYDRLIQQLGINKKKGVDNENLYPKSNEDDLDKNLLLSLFEEIRDLRDKLELTNNVNNELREKLEKEREHPLPMETLKTPSLFPESVLHSINTDAFRDTSIVQNTQSLADYSSLDETPTKDNDSNLVDVPIESITNRVQKLKLSNIHDGFYMSGRLKDFKMLKQIASKLYDKVSACTKKLNSHKNKEKSPNLILVINDVLRLIKELSGLLATFDIMDIKDYPDLHIDDSSQFDISKITQNT